MTTCNTCLPVWWTDSVFRVKPKGAVRSLLLFLYLPAPQRCLYWGMAYTSCSAYSRSLLLSAMVAALSAGPLMAKEKSPPAAESRQVSPFMDLRGKVVAAAKARDWEQAERHARQLLALTDGGNPYERIDAAELLMLALHQLRQYDKAVDVAQTMLAEASAHPEDTINGQVQALISRGLLEAVSAQNTAAITRIQQSLSEESRAYPGLWQWDEAKTQLHYRAAGASFPLHSDRWVLTTLNPAKDRRESTELRYLYQSEKDERLQLNVSLRYRDTPAKEAPSEGTAAAAPDFGLSFVQPGAGDTEQRYGKPPATDADAQQWEWYALHGPWAVRVTAQFAPRLQPLARQQLPLLFAAVQWPKPHELPDARSAQLRDGLMTGRWLESTSQAEWAAAEKQTAAALNDAIFPNEIARLATLQGIAAYRQSRFDQAGKAMEQALKAWPYASIGRGDEELNDSAYTFGADLALRQGRSAEAARLMRHYLRNTGGLSYVWKPDGDQARLRHQRSGQTLPFWSQGLYLQETSDAQRHVYRDLMSNEVLGLTLGLKIPESDEVQEQLLRNALSKQFHLEAGKLSKQAFTPQPRTDGKPLNAQKWVFEVKPQKDRSQSTGKSPAVQRAVFWMVDQGSSRALLRASPSSVQDERKGDQLAQTIDW